MIDLGNWLLHFGCELEYLRVVIARLDDWVANSSPPRSAYCALMACRLVVMDKRPGVCPMEIGETLRRALAKLAMRTDEYQVNTAFGNFQLCAGLEAGIEGATHAVGKRRLERSRERQSEEEVRKSDE